MNYRESKLGRKHAVSSLFGHRSATAFTIVEALVSIVIGAIITGASLQMYSALVRTNTSTQNELSANAITQEMLETTSALGYDYLSGYQGATYPLFTNNPGTISPPPMKPTPVLLDFVNKKWADKVKSAKFVGSAIYQVEPVASIPNALEITCSVTWTDGKTYTGRTISSSTIISKSGLNKWAP